MKEFIDTEMVVHVALCTHKLPKNVLVVENDKYADEVKKHYEADVQSCGVDGLESVESNSCDVVLADISSNPVAFAHINRVLKDDGLVVIADVDLEDVQNTKPMIEILGKYFKIAMPYNKADGKKALLCSKEYHPTADIILQRSDLLDGLNYYNCDVHVGSFAMGNYIRKEYLGVVKN